MIEHTNDLDAISYVLESDQGWLFFGFRLHVVPLLATVNAQNKNRKDDGKPRASCAIESMHFQNARRFATTHHISL